MPSYTFEEWFMLKPLKENSLHWLFTITLIAAVLTGGLNYPENPSHQLIIIVLFADCLTRNMYYALKRDDENAP